MTNREAIKLLKTILRKVCLGNQKFIDAVKKAISALEKQEQDRWISVTERLPEKDCSCRVTEDNGQFKYVVDCYWSNRKKQFEVWSDYNDCYIPLVDVTAWKPSEEPYKAEEEV